jgi:hypothetical protein
VRGSPPRLRLFSFPVTPRGALGAYQDVAWAGFKNEPVISVVNDAIERTHRLTGMPRDEIVRRGLIRNEIPLYTTRAAPIPGLSDQRQ